VPSKSSGPAPDAPDEYLYELAEPLARAHEIFTQLYTTDPIKALTFLRGWVTSDIYRQFRANFEGYPYAEGFFTPVLVGPKPDHLEEVAEILGVPPDEVIRVTSQDIQTLQGPQDLQGLQSNQARQALQDIEMEI
jgi:hypothetical protein